MKNEIKVSMANQSDAVTIGSLVFELLQELYPELGSSYKKESLIGTLRQLLKENSGVWAFLASTGTGERVGVLTLNECAAIYAGGYFGEITELYVLPEYRSSKVGAALVDAAAEFGRKRGWANIEVGAPDVPRWKRTLAFYIRYGFIEVGPRLDLTL